MSRIRTIKPEFPQSESMGRVSRNARLLFIELWTIADDSGRTRGSSRMLASLLFPYDDDAPKLITTWLDELDREGCIVRYLCEGQTYLEICNWSTHQKIDKPTPSKIPAFDEGSRILANPRESSSGDWIGLDQGLDQDHAPDGAGFEVVQVIEPKPSPPSSPRARKAPAERDPLRDALAASFKAKVPEYGSPAKENSNLLRLASAIRRRATADQVDETAAAQGILETFWHLHESGKQFYADFTPSKALAAFESLWTEYRKGEAAKDVSWVGEQAV